MESSRPLTLRLAASGNDRTEQLPLPTGWDARVYPMQDRPALSDEQVARALAEPVAAEPISRAAKGATSAAILVDDFRRPTPAEQLCHLVIDELTAAGVPAAGITIFLGNGAHRPMNKQEVARRLGGAMDRVGRVISHDAYSPDVTYVGMTSSGNPVLVNAAAAAADFSVTIGMVYPHRLTSWAGGAKMVLPGISHVSSIHYHHSRIGGGEWAGAPGKSRSRRDIEEAGRLFGLNVSLCAVINSEGRMCGLAVGEPTKAHAKAVALARRVGATPIDPGPFDLAIVNAYPLDGDATQYTKAQAPALELNCPMLIINDFADPSTYHGLYDGPLDQYRKRPLPPLPEQTEALLMNAGVFMYCPQYGSGFVPPDRTWYCDSDWGRLMEAMVRRFVTPRVAVFPTAPLQLPAARDGGK